MKKIDAVLESALQQEELLRASRAWRVLRQWGEVVGPALAAKSLPDRYDRGTVWVAVTGPAWASELRLQKDQILRALSERAGEPGLFTKLRFGVRPFAAAVVEIDEPDSPAPRLPATGTIREIGERLIKKLQDEGRA